MLRLGVLNERFGAEKLAIARRALVIRASAPDVAVRECAHGRSRATEEGPKGGKS